MTVTPIAACNDFVVKFANVNGSGSASANELFAKSILRMGVPVSPRNIFPSNIQGLPTWYEVRVTEAGWLGRRGGGAELMVAMNPQTWVQDVAEIAPGGYLFHDSTKPLPASRFRDDITVIGMPLTAICNATFSDPRQRQLFKNIMYVGALSQLLGIEAEAIEQLIGEQYRSKEKLLAANREALHLGRDHAREQIGDVVGLRVRRADNVGDRIFVDGNSTAALGCVYGGATVCAWYPITPSSSCAEAFERYCAKLRKDEQGRSRYAIVQAEDEIASIGMVVGAGWNGARAFLPLTTLTMPEGLISFSEALPWMPVLDVSGAAQVKNHDIQLHTTGPLSEAPLILRSSDPSLSQMALLSLLTTGSLPVDRPNAGVGDAVIFPDGTLTLPMLLRQFPWKVVRGFGTDTLIIGRKASASSPPIPGSAVDSRTSLRQPPGISPMAESKDLGDGSSLTYQFRFR